MMEVFSKVFMWSFRITSYTSTFSSFTTSFSLSWVGSLMIRSEMPTENPL